MKTDLSIKNGDWFIADIIGLGIYEMVEQGINNSSMPYAIVRLKKLFMAGFKWLNHETTCHPIDSDKWNNFKVVKNNQQPPHLTQAE